MTISGKITIDGKDYRVLAPAYERGFEPPKTVRRGVLGNHIVSLGPGEAERVTRAVLFIPFEPSGSWGSVKDLEAAAQKAVVLYTDHITGDASKWGSGSSNITILRAEKVTHVGETPRPEPGYTVAVEWMRVL